MDFAVTRMSSKGQIVIPLEMREKFKVGEKVFLIENDGQIILKNKASVKASVLDDLEFARRTEEAYREIESGNFIELSSENLGEMDKW